MPAATADKFPDDLAGGNQEIAIERIQAWLGSAVAEWREEQSGTHCHVHMGNRHDKEAQNHKHKVESRDLGCKANEPVEGTAVEAVRKVEGGSLSHVYVRENQEQGCRSEKPADRTVVEGDGEEQRARSLKDAIRCNGPGSEVPVGGTAVDDIREGEGVGVALSHEKVKKSVKVGCKSEERVRAEGLVEEQGRDWAEEQKEQIENWGCVPGITADGQGGVEERRERKERRREKKKERLRKEEEKLRKEERRRGKEGRVGVAARVMGPLTEEETLHRQVITTGSTDR